MEEYRRAKLAEERGIRQHKRRADEEWGRRLVSSFMENKKPFWSEVRMIRKSKCSMGQAIKDVNGVM